MSFSHLTMYFIFFCSSLHAHLNISTEEYALVLDFLTSELILRCCLSCWFQLCAYVSDSLLCTLYSIAPAFKYSIRSTIFGVQILAFTLFTRVLRTCYQVVLENDESNGI